MKEVFYLKKVRPRDLTEYLGTGSVYLINNDYGIAKLSLKVHKLKKFLNNHFFFDNFCDSSLDIKASI